MPKRALRVVFDTNVVLSALILSPGRMAWLNGLWLARSAVPLVCRETLQELARVLAYAKFKLTPDQQSSAIEYYLDLAETVQWPRPGRAWTGVRTLPQCRDPDDQIFLQLAFAARADALVTGDRDLLALAKKSSIPIITPDDFRALTELEK